MKAPLTPPDSGQAQQEFAIQRVDYSSAEASGRVGGVQAGFPLWSLTWTIGKIGEEKSDDWESFLDELRGATRRFYAGDKKRPYPKRYPDGFSAMTRFDGSVFDGSATSWSQSIDSDDDQTLALHGLPSGFVLGTRDYVGFKWTATEDGIAGLEWRTIVRVVRDGGGTADASGNLTVKVEPPIPDCVPAGAVAYLNQPTCVMVQVSEQTKLGAIDRRNAITGGTIVAVQDLRA